MLRFQLDEISLRFTHKICPQIKKQFGHGRWIIFEIIKLILFLDEMKFAFFIHFNLQNVRQCLTRLANYFFEDVSF